MPQSGFLLFLLLAFVILYGAFRLGNLARELRGRPHINTLEGKAKEDELVFYAIYCSRHLIEWYVNFFVVACTIGTLWLFSCYLQYRIDRIVYFTTGVSVFISLYFVNAYRSYHIFREIDLNVSNYLHI